MLGKFIAQVDGLLDGNTEGSLRQIEIPKMIGRKLKNSLALPHSGPSVSWPHRIWYTDTPLLRQPIQVVNAVLVIVRHEHRPYSEN